MRKAAIGVAVVVVLAAAFFTAARRVPRGGAAWDRRSGVILVAGPAPVWVPRWRWQPTESATAVAEVPAVSKEGARVSVRVVASLPPGRRRLAAAATPDQGLAAVASPAVRGQVADFPLRCLAGLPLAGCPASPEGSIVAALATRLGLPSAALSVELTPDQAEFAAVRLSALRELVGRPSRRVLVVGWDGADWEVLGAMTRKGSMPNLAHLMADGTWGELASITPLLSPLIWTTMATGVSPDVHGILDFVEVDPTSGATVPITGRQRKVPALWNMASAAGLSVNVSGWWATWPAEPVNGVMVSDRLFFLLSDAVGEGPQGTVVYPPDREDAFRALAARAERETDEAVVRALLPVGSDAYRKAAAGHRGMADPIDGYRRIMVGTRTYFGAVLQAAEDAPSPADLTMVYAIGTDEIGHLLSPYLPPPLPGADPAFSRIAAVGVERYFSVVDRWLGRLLATCPESDCAVLVVSDHGFKWGSDRPREFSGTAAATAALWHRPKGVFVLAGKGVARLGPVAESPSVYDVAPTIAALLGLPAGTRWPGKPLPGCATASTAPVDWSLLVPPAAYRPTVAAEKPSPEYLKQLKSLGYMETGEGGGKTQSATEGELNNLGLVQLEAKRYADAERSFRGAIERNPAYASPHYNLRRLLFETGRYDEADLELWRAVDLKLRDSAGASDRAAADYESNGLPERAAALLAEASRRFPDEPRLAVHRLAILVKLGRCPEALQRGREAATRFGSDARVHAFCGIAAACAGDRATATSELRRALELDPNQPEIRQALEAVSAEGTRK